jgi:hypothetical protein
MYSALLFVQKQLCVASLLNKTPTRLIVAFGLQAAGSKL